ncbi:MAG TPA: TonB-dependent receptor, partial [Myxococcota bacterium]
LLEGVHLDTTGFKELDRLPGEERPNTGFDRNDVMLKARLGSSWLDSTRHAVDLKLTYGDEDSHETYVGLTDADLKDNPYRRYRATAGDRMQWRRFGGQIGYSFVVDDVFDVKVTAYRHDFHRAWRRLNRFLQGPSIEDVLLHPDAGQNAVFMRILRGELDSETAGQTLGIATNDRTFYSQGIQAVSHLQTSPFGFFSNTEFGVRLHNDSITRLHTEDGKRMISGALVPDGRETTITTANTATATALSAWIVEEARFGPLTLLPGVRMELVDTSLVDSTLLLNGGATEATTQDDLQLALLPGIGAAVDVPFATLFGGVHRGYSPKAPGQSADVLPETSWNVEVGGRTTLKDTRAELVGYWSPYENIVGQCTLSAGCIDDGAFAQTNGGAALVYGVEAALGHTFRIMERASVSADVVYTFTHATFSTTFSSGTAIYGDVVAGDYLPYVPMHQGSVTVGADVFGFKGGLVASYLGEMRDLPGQGERGDDGREIGSGETFADAQLILDANVGYEVWKNGTFYVRLDNITGQQGAVSHRPFGGRPTKPTSFLVGFKQSF